MDIQPPSQTEKDTPIILWEIPSHEHQLRGFGFFVIVLTIMVILLLFSIWQKNFLFGMFTIIATGMALYLSVQNPDIHTFSLNQKSIVFGNYKKTYSYEEFAYFDVQEFSDTDIEIFFAFKDKQRLPIHLRIHKADQDAIISLLKEKKLTEKDIDISLFDSISKLLGI